MVFEIYGARVFDVLIRIPDRRRCEGSLIRLCTRVCSFGLRLSIGASDLSITHGNERSMMVLVVRVFEGRNRGEAPSRIIRT
jgi:hypothetical protein